MSWQCVRRVFDYSRARGSARLVLLAIAERADEHGRGAFLSSTQLQAACLIDDRTVRRSLRELEDLGELAIVGRARNGSNAFEVTVAADTPGIMPGGHNTRGGGHTARGGRAIDPGGPGNMPSTTKRSGTEQNETEIKIRDLAVAKISTMADEPEKDITPTLRALARAIIRERPEHWLGAGYGDLANEVKCRAAKMKLPYAQRHDSVREAIDGAQAQIIREGRAS